MSHPRKGDEKKDKININGSNNEKQDAKALDEVENSLYAVTISKDSSTCCDGKCSSDPSFIRIHSTDQLCQVETENSLSLDDCDIEILCLNKIFPSTSEDSVSNEVQRAQMKNMKRIIHNDRGSYAPTNSKSLTTSDVYSNFNIMKNTLHVVGSNPGEPKMSYQDPPQKTKNLIQKVEKRKRDTNAGRTLSYATLRGILKDARCDSESTGDSSFHGDEEYRYAENLQYAINYGHGLKSADKNVSFDTQVLIFHFTGDLCVGQSVETLNKENDQQERNSELRKTFLKYTELWPKNGKRKK